MVDGMDVAHEMVLWKVEPQCSIAEADDFERLSRLLDRPRVKIERKLSFDERSLSELSVTGNLRPVDSYDSLCSPGAGRSVLDTPVSLSRNSFEPHPMVGEAWDALRRSIVFFRGQPVGTIAAIDHASEEVLNYDQVEQIPIRSRKGDILDLFFWIHLYLAYLIQVFLTSRFKIINLLSTRQAFCRQDN